MWQSLLCVIVDVFAYFEVSLAAAGQRLVKRIGQVRQLLLRHQRVRRSSQRFDDLMIQPGIQPFAERQQRALFLESELVAQALAQIPARVPCTANPCRAADTSAFARAPAGRSIQVPMASGWTCAPSRSRKSNIR